MNGLVIVGVSGKARHGKDAIAERLVARHGFVRFAFADALKEAAGGLFQLSHDQLYGATKEVVDPRWGRSPRQILQLFGTEAIRDVFGVNTWIDVLAARINSRMNALRHVGAVGVVIPDVRFENEARGVLGWQGEVWRVVRPGIAAVNEHSSETALDAFGEFSRVVENNRDLVDLNDKVDRLAEKLLTSRK